MHLLTLGAMRLELTTSKGCAWRAFYVLYTGNSPRWAPENGQRIVKESVCFHFGLDPTWRSWTREKKGEWVRGPRFVEARLFGRINSRAWSIYLPNSIFGKKIPWWKLDGRRS